MTNVPDGLDPSAELIVKHMFEHAEEQYRRLLVLGVPDRLARCVLPPRVANKIDDETERDARNLYLRPIDPDPVAALAKHPIRET
jgi:hypothetical protein